MNSNEIVVGVGVTMTSKELLPSVVENLNEVYQVSYNYSIPPDRDNAGTTTNFIDELKEKVNEKLKEQLEDDYSATFLNRFWQIVIPILDTGERKIRFSDSAVGEYLNGLETGTLTNLTLKISLDLNTIYCDIRPSKFNPRDLTGLAMELEGHKSGLVMDNLSNVDKVNLSDGSIFATIDDAWKGESQEFEGFFEGVVVRRGNNGPLCIRKIAEFLSSSYDNNGDQPPQVPPKVASNSDNEMGESLTNTTATESLTKKDKRQKMKNIFGGSKRQGKSRAHLLPDDESCFIFWGMVCEAVSGMYMGEFTDGKKKFIRREMPDGKKKFIRREMPKILKDWAINLFPFATNHNQYFDLLDEQCVMVIPLLSLDEIAIWKESEGYEVLICCNSSDTIRELSGSNWNQGEKFKHIFWEEMDNGDAEKATKVLTEYTKALADSLKNNWGYFDSLRSDHKDFERKKKRMVNAWATLENNKVEVPILKEGRKKQFFKVNLAQLYETEREGKLKMMIPDPRLLSIKSAVNWSGRTQETMRKKLLTCCSASVETDDVSFYSQMPSNASFGDAFANLLPPNTEQLATAYADQFNTNLLNLEIQCPNVVSDSDDDDSNSCLSMPEFEKEERLDVGNCISGDSTK